MALSPGGRSKALWWSDLKPLVSQSWVLCLQMLLSKYNQQYHKLFKDIPLEEMVLKGELLPAHGWRAPRSSTWGIFMLNLHMGTI